MIRTRPGSTLIDLFFGYQDVLYSTGDCSAGSNFLIGDNWTARRDADRTT